MADNHIAPKSIRKEDYERKIVVEPYDEVQAYLDRVAHESAIKAARGFMEMVEREAADMGVVVDDEDRRRPKGSKEWKSPLEERLKRFPVDFVDEREIDWGPPVGDEVW